jgi:DNA ligase-1
MIDFGRACKAVAATASRLEKVRLIAEYLHELDELNLPPATRFFTGNPFPQTDERSLAVGARTIIDAASNVWRIISADFRSAYVATGDLGAALGTFFQTPMDLGLFREPLTPATLYEHLLNIADSTGKNAQKKRRILVERILSACGDGVETTYVVKVMTGELRIGLREGLISDAIASAFNRSPDAVRRAASAAADIGAVALAARNDTLNTVSIGYHSPISFMLASSIVYGSQYGELAGHSWIIDDKYDGIRAQAHVTPGRVSLFSRTLNDVAASYPEVVACLRTLPGSFILDGELIAAREGKVLPFRSLQARLQRKAVGADLLREVPVRYMAFDALAQDDDVLLDLASIERRTRLVELLRGVEESVAPAPWTELKADGPLDVIEERFADARLRGHEGLLLKRADAPYSPGRRGRAWYKLKRELATLDCVVVAVERGHGRRIGVLSDYTFAVRDGDKLVVIGKAYSGLTDAEIAEMTAWFNEHRITGSQAQVAYEQLALKRNEVMVEPRIVVEVAFDVVQRSSLHGSGFSLRFPRIVRLRDDKLPLDADTLDRVTEIYVAMLAREATEGDPWAAGAQSESPHR